MKPRERYPGNEGGKDFIPRPRYRPGLFIFLMALILLGFETPAAAFNATTVVNVDAALASSAQLTITPSAINFPNADPDTVPSIPAIENPVQVTTNAQTPLFNIITLTVLAQGDLVSGSDSIAINNVSWTATGIGFRSGTMSRTAPQLAGRWFLSGTRRGTFSFFLNNSWSYATGHYSQTVTYTLTAP